MTRRGRTAFLVAALACASPPAGRADEPVEPSYAGKPATWWVGELERRATRAVAREALAAIGETVLPALESVWTHEDPDVRAAGAAILDALGPRETTGLDAMAPVVGSDDPVVAAAALRFVTRVGPLPPSLVPAVSARLADPNDGVRAAAILALRNAGDPGQTTLADAVIAWARSEATIDRARAFESLSHLGPGAAPRLAAILEAIAPTTEHERLRLVQAVARVDVTHPAALPLFEAGARSRWPGLPDAAVDALAERAAKTSDDAPILALASDADLSVVRAAVAAVAKRPALVARAVPALAAAASGGDSMVTHAVVVAFVGMGEALAPHVPALVASLPPPALAGVLRRDAPSVILRKAADTYPGAPSASRAVIAEALANAAVVGWTRGASDLAAALRRDVGRLEPAGLERSALQALVRLANAEPSHATLLVEAVLAAQDPDPALDGTAASAGARIALLDALGHERAETRRRALQVLLRARLNPVEAGAVTRLLGDPDVEVRVRAALAVARTDGALAGRGARSRGRGAGRSTVAAADLPALLSVLEEACGHASSAVRSDAVRALALLGAEAKPALPALARALGDRERVVSGSAAQSIVQVALAAGVPLREAVAAAAASGDPLARAGAAEALARIPESTRETLDLLRSVLDDADGSGRTAALATIARMGIDASALASRVKALESDPDPAVAAAARGALQAMRGPERGR